MNVIDQLESLYWQGEAHLARQRLRKAHAYDQTKLTESVPAQFGTFR